ncbi:GBS Bsp-like repeat-containing protein [Streptococcus dentiloxodontae]
MKKIQKSLLVSAGILASVSAAQSVKADEVTTSVPDTGKDYRQDNSKTVITISEKNDKAACSAADNQGQIETVNDTVSVESNSETTAQSEDVQAKIVTVSAEKKADSLSETVSETSSVSTDNSALSETDNQSESSEALATSENAGVQSAESQVAATDSEKSDTAANSGSASDQASPKATAETAEADKAEAKDIISKSDETTVTISKIDKAAGTFTVTADGGENKDLEHLDVAIWSQDNDQDDIIWYRTSQIDSDNRASVNFDVNNHGGLGGDYIVHVYATYLDGSKVGINAGKVTIDNPIPTVTVEGGAIVIEYSRRAPKGSSYGTAVWSNRNGQDDLVWYTVPENGRLSVALAEHRNTGTYNVHTYLYTKEKTIGLNATTINVESITAPKVELVDNHINVKFSHGATQNTALQVAIWSDKNGQDDLKWYDVSKDGQLSLELPEDADYGDYQVHAYQVIRGNMKGISATSVKYAEPTPATATITEKSEGSYLVSIKDVPDKYVKVTVPVWSQQGDQDDIIWYDATKEKDGSYSVVIKTADHHFNTGVYNIHVYGQSKSGKLTGLIATEVEVAGTREVINANPEAGSFDVVISAYDGAKTLSSVAVAVWSEDDQSNIYWYKDDTIDANGNFKISADVTKHGNKTGIYHIHAYVTDKEGHVSGYVLDNQKLIAQSTSANAQKDTNTNQTPAHKPSNSAKKADIKLSNYFNSSLNSDQKASLDYGEPSGKAITTGYINNGYTKGYDTWYVFNRVTETGGVMTNGLGAAGQWASNASANGYKTGAAAKAGAIVQFGAGVAGASSAGHVAFVEHVNSDGSILISEMCNKNQFNYRTVTPQAGMTFIYA